MGEGKAEERGEMGKKKGMRGQEKKREVVGGGESTGHT